MEKVFVYGSLRTDFWNYDKVLKNRVRKVEKGSITGSLYHLPAGYPAVIQGEETVYGEVFTLSNPKIIKSLDLLEGYIGEGEDNLYIREKRKVVLEDGREEVCFVYLFVEEKHARQKGKFIKHGDWKKFIEHYKA